MCIHYREESCNPTGKSEGKIGDWIRFSFLTSNTSWNQAWTTMVHWCKSSSREASWFTRYGLLADKLLWHRQDQGKQSPQEQKESSKVIFQTAVNILYEEK